MHGSVREVGSDDRPYRDRYLNRYTLLPYGGFLSEARFTEVPLAIGNCITLVAPLPMDYSLTLEIIPEND